MESFHNWYVRNQDAITWFLIGSCSFSAVYNLVNGHYLWAISGFVLAYGNYKLKNVKLQ